MNNWDDIKNLFRRQRNIGLIEKCLKTRLKTDTYSFFTCGAVESLLAFMFLAEFRILLTASAKMGYSAVYVFNPLTIKLFIRYFHPLSEGFN